MNTATLLTVVLGFVTLLLAIFGASWLNQRQFERQIDLLRQLMDARFASVEARLDKIERQLEAIFKPVLPH